LTPVLARGVTDAYDTIQVKHYRSDGTPDGVSTLTFKSYEQGQKKHQGEPIDFDWCDEEPPEDVYSEILTRTTATDGMVMVTFTPLQGRSNVVTKYMDEPADSRAYIVMTIEDAEHIPAEKRAAIIAAWPAHERDARARGIPMMGSGRIFPYPHEAIIEQPILHIPAYWVKGWGIDFGINHPFAANLMLWDKDNDVIHVHATIRMADALPLQHAQPMLIQGAAVPVFWPQDGTQRSKDGTGEPLAAAYRKHKLLMHHEHDVAGRRAEHGSRGHRNAGAHHDGPVQGREPPGGLAARVRHVPPQGRPDRQGQRRPDLGHAEGAHDEALLPRRGARREEDRAPPG
jgi:phage terminase large subunit-like protein